MHNFPIMIVALFLRSAQSACFSPSKFGLLPELLPERAAFMGQWCLRTWHIRGHHSGHRRRIGHARSLHRKAVVGGSDFRRPVVRRPGFRNANRPDSCRGSQQEISANFIGEFVSQLGLIKQDRTLFLAVLGNTFFYFVAALLQFNIAIYAVDVLKISETQAVRFRRRWRSASDWEVSRPDTFRDTRSNTVSFRWARWALPCLPFCLSVPHLSFVELALAAGISRFGRRILRRSS